MPFDPVLLLTALVALIALAAIVLAVRRPAGAGAAASETARLTQEREEARAALETERTAHEATRAQLGETRENLREAAVTAGRVTGLEEKLAEAQRRAHDAEKELEGLQRQAAERDRSHRENLERLTEFRQDMEKQFKALSHEALAAQSESFTKSSKERLETMLSPLRDQIGKFEKEFRSDGEARVAQRTAMETLVQTLKEQTAQVQTEAHNLTKALKGSAQTQGAWGEMILRTILEKAGLREGEEFVTQDHQTTEEGGRHRPDVVVNFPDGKKLVIDSKVSLTAFERCVNCEDEAERAAHLKEHLTSLRRHIRGLADKDYAQHYGGVDFVILFVPMESALSLAIQNDPDIQTQAAGLNVMIASPNTLLMGLRTVQNMWVRERQHQNAEAIADRAGKLYDKFVGFVDDLKKVGTSIERAHSQYEDAFGKLKTGRGNLIGQAEKLRDMGARTSKQLPETLLELSEDKPAPSVESGAAAPARAREQEELDG